MKDTIRSTHKIHLSFATLGLCTLFSLSIGGIITQEYKVMASDGNADVEFGFAVDLHNRIIGEAAFVGMANTQSSFNHSRNTDDGLQRSTDTSTAVEDVSWELIRPTNTGILGDFCFALFIDDDDSPWISGYTPFWEEGGVSHFDGSIWNSLNNFDCDQITSPRFEEIVKTEDGIMWIVSDGLLRFDPAVEPWCVTRLHAGNTPMPTNSINDIAVAPDGSLWLAISGSPSGALAQYTPSTDTWEIWDTSNGIPWDAVWNYVEYVAVQPNTTGGYTVWFGNGPMGLASYDDGVWTWYGGSNPPNISPLPVDVVGERSVDDQGNMLLITDEGYALRAPDGTYTLIPTPSGSGYSTIDILEGGRVAASSTNSFSIWDGAWTSVGHWGGGTAQSYGEESSGAIWVSGVGGAARYENGFWQRYRISNTGMLDFWPRGIAFAPNGDVAMTANGAPGIGGFDILHPDRSWTNANVATYGLGLPWPYLTDNSDAVAYRSNGNLLFAPTNNGLREYDGDGYVDRIATGARIQHIEIAGDGTAWAAAKQAGPTFGLYKEDSSQVWTETWGYSDGVSTGDLVSLVADPLDPSKVFVAGWQGVARTDGTTWDIWPRDEFGLTLNTTSHTILSFEVGLDGTMWVGAAGMGLHEYNPTTGTYIRHDTTNTPLPTAVVQDLEIAPDGSLWVSVMDLQNFPYPGGLAHYKDGQWRVWSEGSSPLPHNQVYDLQTRSIPGGYEVWIACASEAIAVMTIKDTAPCIADLNGDGVLNFFDVSAFLGAFASADPIADFNGDGVFNFFDVSAFLNAFNAGCP